MKYLIIISLLIFGCEKHNVAQEKSLGFCEICDALYEYGDKVLTNVDTLSGYNTLNNKLRISGIVYKNDGKTPADNVIIYIYHTDHTGLYPKKGDETGWAKRHGYLRGWIKTGKDGKYTFYTSKPSPYPSGNIPAHIHFVIKEEGYKAYYIEDILFSDDPLIKNQPQSSKPRGGNGIINLKNEKGILVAERNIILGLNIPGY